MGDDHQYILGAPKCNNGSSETKTIDEWITKDISHNYTTVGEFNVTVNARNTVSRKSLVFKSVTTKLSCFYPNASILGEHTESFFFWHPVHVRSPRSPPKNVAVFYSTLTDHLNKLFLICIQIATNSKRRGAFKTRLNSSPKYSALRANLYSPLLNDSQGYLININSSVPFWV